MTIGIDIDDTITETTLKANEYLKEFDEDFKEDYHKHPKYEEFMALYRKKIMQNVSLAKHVKEAFDFFDSNGYKIIIITYRPETYAPDVNNITIEFFKKHGLKYEKLINTYDKGIAAKENKVDIFIDDKIVHLDDVNQYGIECIRFSNKNDSKYKTFSNWYDIIEYVKSRKD